jgi:hypothetical protein
MVVNERSAPCFLGLPPNEQVDAWLRFYQLYFPNLRVSLPRSAFDRVLDDLWQVGMILVASRLSSREIVVAMGRNGVPFQSASKMGVIVPAETETDPRPMRDYVVAIPQRATPGGCPLGTVESCSALEGSYTTLREELLLYFHLWVLNQRYYVRQGELVCLGSREVVQVGPGATKAYFPTFSWKHADAVDQPPYLWFGRRSVDDDVPRGLCARRMVFHGPYDDE